MKNLYKEPKRFDELSNNLVVFQIFVFHSCYLAIAIA